MNLNITKKRLFFIGFFVTLLIGIPLTIFLLQRQQEIRSRAEKSTNITFTPESTSTTPLRHKVGDNIPLDIMVDPGKNLVSYIKLEIQYDPDKLATSGASTFTPNTVAFPGVFEGPVYTTGKIAVTLSVGPDPTKAIQQIVKAGTLTLKAIANTPPGTPTLVSYASNTQVLSIGADDQASENVLSAATPATIEIAGGGSTQPTTGPTGVVTQPPEQIPSAIPTPTLIAQNPSGIPTTVLSPTATPTQSPSIPVTPNQAPLCNSLTADRQLSGAAPFSITFTANGSDSDGTISKVTFNFGDGQVSDATTAGGIGTNSVNVQLAHTYNNPGTYQVSAILTDNNNAVSSTTSCKQTVTVTASNSTKTDTALTPTPTTAPTQVTLEPTGTADVAIGIGVAAMLLIIGGGLLFLLL